MTYEDDNDMAIKRNIRSEFTKYTKTRGIKGVADISSFRAVQLVIVCNDGTRAVLEVEELATTARRYKMWWKVHVMHMFPSRIPRTMMEYAPHGNRNVSRPRLRW